MTLREYGALLAQATTRERRENARAARLMALMANLWAPRDDKQPHKVADFMPEEGGAAREAQPGERAPMDWEVMKQMVMHANAALGGEFIEPDADAKTPTEEG